MGNQHQREREPSGRNCRRHLHEYFSEESSPNTTWTQHNRGNPKAIRFYGFQDVLPMVAEWVTPGRWRGRSLYDVSLLVCEKGVIQLSEHQTVVRSGISVARERYEKWWPREQWTALNRGRTRDNKKVWKTLAGEKSN